MNTDTDIPEPQEEEKFDVQEGFALMQMQFVKLMEKMEENTRQVEAVSAEQTVMRDEVAASVSLTPSKQRAVPGRLIPKTTPTAVNRRTSQFYKQPEDIRVPKMLAEGFGIKDMKKYGGKPKESLHEHFLTFEYHARLQNEVFWCDLLQLTMTPTVQDAIKNHAVNLRAGRNADQDCPTGWYDYTELKVWLHSKYHRDQFEMELLSRILFQYEQTATLDAYLTLLDIEIATVSNVFSDSLKKMLVLAKMDRETSKVMSTKPETYNQPYSAFCKKALLVFDSLQSTVKKITKKAPYVPKKYDSDRTIMAFELVSEHVSKSGKKTFTSPWAPDNTRYDKASPPCNFCYSPDHYMKTCAKLWLKYYHTKHDRGYQI